MKIIEQTPTRLVFTSGIPWLQNFHCDLDRTTGRARIARTDFFIRRKPVEVALADITAAKAWSETSGQSASDMVGIFLKSGECIRLPMPSFGKSSPFKEIVSLVNGFLAAHPA